MLAAGSGTTNMLMTIQSRAHCQSTAPDVKVDAPPGRPGSPTSRKRKKTAQNAAPKHSDNGVDEPAVQARPSRVPAIMPIFASAFAVRFGGIAAASECPKHFADTQALIDKVSTDMERTRAHMSKEEVALVRELLDDARMFLAAAQKNHKRPRWAFDHARAFAKADAALGHARAAEVIQARLRQI
jgi:hypothetical protein